MGMHCIARRVSQPTVCAGTVATKQSHDAPLEVHGASRRWSRGEPSHDAPRIVHGIARQHGVPHSYRDSINTLGYQDCPNRVKQTIGGFSSGLLKCTEYRTTAAGTDWRLRLSYESTSLPIQWLDKLRLLGSDRIGSDRIGSDKIG
jgi:hypothetical protein